MAEQIKLPIDFRLVRVNFPVDLDRQMGYAGKARFVGLYWDAAGDDTAWTDGKETKVGGGDWEAFVRYVGQTGLHFQVSFGRMEEEATHLFIWDRAVRAAYVAVREEGEAFLKAQHG